MVVILLGVRVTTINGIYLPGWEYNRILADDPLKPRNSALPGALLWNGAAPLWMFEKVYCTAESLENEQYAAQELGWATSTVFGQLAAGLPGSGGPILEPVRWDTLGTNTAQLLRATHKDIQRGGPIGHIRRWIDEANDPELERVNQALLRPVATAMNSIVAGSMSGLRHWLPPSSTDNTVLEPMHATEQIQHLLSLIAKPVAAEPSLNGVRIVRPPQEWDPHALVMQDEVKKRVETPFIRDLQAGEGAFTGPRGYEPYVDGVAIERHAYRDIDTPLLADWDRNAPRLLRLREVASKHLWPTLHGDWLPAMLREEPEALKDFPRYIKQALAARHFAGLLTLNTKQVIGLLSAVAAVTAIGAPTVWDSPGFIAALAGGAYATFGEARQLAPKTGPLAVFYQEAFRTLQT